MTSKTIHLVTAVSRPQNLPRIYNSIRHSLEKTDLTAEWILVGDRWKDLESVPEIGTKFYRLNITKTVDNFSGPSPYGIRQKNLGMGMIKQGYFHCLDDDNIVHPNFFSGIEPDVKAGTQAICFNQKRWDMLGTLQADPRLMDYGQIDNTMFVVDIGLIGAKRYSLEDAGKEDWLFFSQLHAEHPKQFVFLKKTIAYYNYIHQFPIEPIVGFDKIPR
jgi:hypothetical protein